MTRRRLILPLIWLAVTLLAVVGAIAPPLPSPDAASTHHIVFVVYTPMRIVRFIAPFAVFTIAYGIIDAWLQLSYRRWLAWAQTILNLSGAAVPALATRLVMAQVSSHDFATAFGALRLVWLFGYFATLLGFICFVAVLISVVMRAWKKPAPN